MSPFDSSLYPPASLRARAMALRNEPSANGSEAEAARGNMVGEAGFGPSISPSYPTPVTSNPGAWPPLRRTMQSATGVQSVPLQL